MMSNISSFTGKFRIQKSGADNPSSAKGTKRPRESLVCDQCRRSKLRCDRRQPCSSCTNRNDAESCSYHKGVDSNTEHRSKSSVEGRLAHLESLVTNLMWNNNESTPPNPNSDSIPLNGQFETKDSFHEVPDLGIRTTSYTGSTHWSAMLEDIHELRAVLTSQPETPETQESLELDTSSIEIIFGSSNAYSLQQTLQRYLPPKSEIDQHISLFFRGETFIVPIIHTNQFQRQYQDFWADTTTTNPLWISMLFSVCCMASLIREQIASNSRSKERPNTESSRFHAAAAQCLVIGDYHRPQKYAVEALGLYAQCKNLSSLDSSREASSILSMAVRTAFEMGYHRDPDYFGSLSVFEGEMRRRCWSACKQMDVMMSFQLGLPSNICLENCDTKSPRNLLDSDFDEDTKVLPPSRPDTQATRLLWFIVKDKQMTSFSKVARDALSFKERSEAEILQLDDEIQEMFSTVPEILRTKPISDSITESPFLIMTRYYIEFMYLKSLCVLHRRYMVKGNLLSTRSCVDAGKRIVHQFIAMYEEFSPGGLLYAERWMLTTFTMNDYLLGVMVLCQVVHIHYKKVSENPAIDSTTYLEVRSLLEKSYDICLEKSQISQDAKRVSYAIKATLYKARAFSGQETDSGKDMEFTGSGTVNQASSLQLDDDGIVENETQFDVFDSLNFLGADFDTFDWSLYDSQVLG